MKGIIKRAMIIVVFWGLCLVSYAPGQEAPLDHGLSPLEQEILYLVNLGRAKPFLMAEFLGMDVDFLRSVAGEWLPLLEHGMPPVAPDQRLCSASRGHSMDMLDRLYYSYITPEGQTPHQRVSSQGYPALVVRERLGLLVLERFVPAHDAAMALFRNIFMDELTPGRFDSPRMFDPSVRDVGIGVEGGLVFLPGVDGEKRAYVLTCDFAQNLYPSSPVVLGVVFEDCNGDGMFTAGEGLGGVEVVLTRAGGEELRTRTWASGGYALPVDGGGFYDMRVSGGEMGDAVEGRLVPVGSDNVVVDIMLPAGAHCN